MYSYFEGRFSEKMCTRQSQKVIWDMINTLFLMNVAVEFTLLLSFSTPKHMSMGSSAILSNFFEEQWTQNHSEHPLGLSCALFLTTFLKITTYTSTQISKQSQASLNPPLSPNIPLQILLADQQRFP